MTNTISQTAKELCWLENALKTQSLGSGDAVKISYIGVGALAPKSLFKGAPPATLKRLKEKSSLENWQTGSTRHYALQAQAPSLREHNGLFSPQPYAMARELVGTTFCSLFQKGLKSLTVDYIGDSEAELLGIVVGLEMGAYHFKKQWPKNSRKLMKVRINSRLKNHKEVIKEGLGLGQGTNLARLLVDLPPNILGPKSYADFLKSQFSGRAKTRVSVWNHQKLKSERMGLHLAVGQGSTDQSYMVHVEYRNAGKAKPWAFVGKGITFDAGGLDIKPSQGMRLMKKDMGGSASVAGLAEWVCLTQPALNVDFYFAIAENSISDKSFRPGDIITARNGKTVEIHNTDAEGRLVLADVMSLASEAKPQAVIDVATLTGAIKMSLGGSCPGLFCNQDSLAETLMGSAKERGDICWRMPLIPEERSRLKSDVADMVNATEGFGGAITGALFLESFIGDTPWAHFDIYAWVDRAKGLYSASGGSGQLVQALSHFLTEQASNQAG